MRDSSPEFSQVNIKEPAIEVQGKIEKIENLVVRLGADYQRHQDGQSKAELYINARKSVHAISPGYQLKIVDIRQFLRSRRVHVVINSYQNHLRFHYGEARKTSLGYMLKKWVAMLVANAQIGRTPIQKEIFIEFKFQDQALDFGCHEASYWLQRQDALAPILWFRVHASHAVQRMRLDLLRRRPGSGITIRSNVNSPIHGSMVTERVSAEAVRLWWTEDDSTAKGSLRVENGVVLLTRD